MTRRWAPQTRYTLRCNTASIIKDLVWLFFTGLIQPVAKEETKPQQTCDENFLSVKPLPPQRKKSTNATKAPLTQSPSTPSESLTLPKPNTLHNVSSKSDQNLNSTSSPLKSEQWYEYKSRRTVCSHRLNTG